MTNKVLLDTVTTDSRGIATFNLTGSGRGKIQVQAEANDGALQSPVFVVYDSLIKDIGVRGQSSEVWKDYLYENYNRASVERKVVSGYTILNGLDVEHSRLYLDYDLPAQCFIEFDAYVNSSNTTDLFISLRNGDTYVKGLSLKQCGLSKYNWGHVKLEIDDTTLTVNDSRVYVLNGTVDRFYWYLSQINSMRFKNFTVYE